MNDEVKEVKCEESEKELSKQRGQTDISYRKALRQEKLCVPKKGQSQ